MLEAEKAVEGVNPYRFHALKFIAESMAEQGDYAKACLLYTSMCHDDSPLQVITKSNYHR